MYIDRSIEACFAHTKYGPRRIHRVECRVVITLLTVAIVTLVLIVVWAILFVVGTREGK